MLGEDVAEDALPAVGGGLVGQHPDGPARADRDGGVAGADGVGAQVGQAAVAGADHEGQIYPDAHKSGALLEYAGQDIGRRHRL